ncbi:MAG: hypothetical protein ACRDZY_19690 [Acidimicrobiales bacterium]
MPYMALAEFAGGVVLELQERGPGDLAGLAYLLALRDGGGTGVCLEGAKRLLERQAYMLSFRMGGGTRALVAAKVSVVDLGPRGCPRPGARGRAPESAPVGPGRHFPWADGRGGTVGG